jgi:hypothetical protein
VVLADVSDEEIAAGSLTEVEHVGIAKTVSPDLRQSIEQTNRQPSSDQQQ